MIINLILAYSVINFAATDTLLLPIRNGILLEAPASCLGRHEGDDIMILPAHSFEVASCSAGKVTMVQRYDDSTYAVVLRTGTIYYAYTNMDSVFVAKGDSIQKTQVIGKLKQQLAKGERREDFALSFFVLNKDKSLNPRKYLVHTEN